MKPHLIHISLPWTGRERTIFYSTRSLPPAHKHSDIYLQLCMWEDYHWLLIRALVFTRLLFDEILPPYQITIWLIDWWCMFICLLDNLILVFCYCNLIRETRGFELPSVIILVLQANQLTKCASHIPPCVRKISKFMEFTFLENALIRGIFTHAPAHSKITPKFLSSRPREKEITDSPSEHSFENLFPPTDEDELEY